MAKEDQFISGNEAMKRYGIAHPTLVRMRACGDLQAYRSARDSRMILYKVSDLENLANPIPLPAAAKRKGAVTR